MADRVGRASRPPAPPRWYALAVETRREAPVRRRLEHAGVEHYLPIEERRQHRAGRALTLRRLPFLPGYMFVRLPRPAFFLDDAHGIIGLVRMGDAAIAVPDAALAGIRALEDGDGVIRPQRAPARRFVPGQRVRVTDGAWSGFTGEVLTMKRHDRVRQWRGGGDGLPDQGAGPKVGDLRRAAERRWHRVRQPSRPAARTARSSSSRATASPISSTRCR
ncbi:MAG: hypothetical protein HY060_06295 [Proteobacteria bacterium]|nr:hypothetical protein [Pseudomonadota bacterium]